MEINSDGEVLNAISVALKSGKAASVRALAPAVNSLHKDDQARVIRHVVDAHQVDLVRALEPVKWKFPNWKYVALHHACGVGFTDLVNSMAGEIDSIKLPFCLQAAVLSPTTGRLDTVKILAPMVHAAKHPIVPAISDALLTIHRDSSILSRYCTPENRASRKQATMEVLVELFRYMRVDRFLKAMMKEAGHDQTAKVLPYLVEFLSENLSSQEFIKNQAGMRAATPGPWSGALAKISDEGDWALRAVKAACEAHALDRKVDQARPANIAGSRAPGLTRF